MVHAGRQTAADLADVLLADAKNFDFFRLLESLYKLHGDDLEAEDRLRPARQRVRLSSYAGLAFPASDIAQAQRSQPEAMSDYEVMATFFGLHGPDSPLPSHYFDRLAYEAGQGIGIRPAFLDVIHHRLLLLLHQAWRKYRYYIRFQQDARDHFSRYVFSLIGLGNTRLRGETPIAWSRLLSYAGVVAGRSRSPAIVAGIIAHCFDLDSVRIRQFEMRYAIIPDDQRNAVGKRNCTLRHDFVVGRRAQTRESKFTIVISELTQARFRALLPSGSDFPRLCKLIEFLLRDQHAYDLELGLRRDEVQPFNLSKTDGSHLGWTSFFKQSQGKPGPTVRVKVRL